MSEKKEKLYKGEFIIALYDSEDQVMAVGDNPKDIARQVGIPTESACSEFGRMIREKSKPNKRAFIYARGRKCTAFFVSMTRDLVISSSQGVVVGHKATAACGG